MEILEEIFKFKKTNFDKLVKYGFISNNNVYEFKTDILDGEFELYIYVDVDGKVSTKVIEKQLGEEYVLHLMKEAVGEFVGRVRYEFENILKDISEKCFEKNIFKSKQANEIIEYVYAKYGDELEYLWEKFPTDAVFRRKDNAKWYGLLVVLPKNKLGIKSDEVVDIIDLRIQPEEIEKVVDGKRIFEAYHMNKKHWFTIILDGSVPTSSIVEFLDKSYALAKK